MCSASSSRCPLGTRQIRMRYSFFQEEELLARVRLLSSEAKDWNSRVVSEAEQVLVKESAEAAHRTNERGQAVSSLLETSRSTSPGYA